MNNIFKFDGTLFTFLSRFCDILIVSILWMVFSLPIVTIGPASAALYHTIHKVFFNNESYLFSTFWGSFRTNLKQGVLLTLLCIPLAAFCILSYLFSNSLGTSSVLGAVYLAVTILSTLFLLIMLTYTFPVLSRFYMTIPNILKTTIALAITRMGFTLILILIFLLCAGAFLIAPFTGFVLPACFAIASERLIEPGFRKAVEAKEHAEQVS